jgi:hypothetical protein
MNAQEQIPHTAPDPTTAMIAASEAGKFAHEVPAQVVSLSGKAALVGAGMEAAVNLGKPTEATPNYDFLLNANDPTAGNQRINTEQQLEEVRPGYYYDTGADSHLRQQ